MSVSAQLRAHAAAILVCDEREPLLSFEMPLRLLSEANQRGHWAKKAGRVSDQRDAVTAMFKTHWRRSTAWFNPTTVIVRLVRIAPRSLDTDNLASALKATQDAVAAALGVDDKRLEVVRDQERGKPKTHAVRIEVYAR